VVYVFYINDYTDLQHATYFDIDSTGAVSPVPPRDSLRQVKTWFSSLPGARPLQEHSHVVALIRYIAVSLTGANNQGDNTIQLDTLSAPTAYSEPYRQWLASEYVSALQEEVEQRGARFLAFYAPSAAEVAALRRTGTPTEDEHALLAVLRRHSIDGLAFTQPLAETGAPIAALYFPEIHWRPLGHRVAARAMLDPVQAALCVQTPEAAGCATAPPDVRRIVERRVGRGSGG
jgi:hypothetical protein